MSDLQKLLQRLDGAGVDFVPVGGYAAMRHGSSLLTRDIDVRTTLTPATIEKLVEPFGTFIRGIACPHRSGRFSTIPNRAWR